MKLKAVLIIITIAFVSACDKSGNKNSQNLLLVFGEKEPEVEPYKTRMIITPEFMRFDDGEGSTDYLLFDRTKKTIYNVVQSSKTITIITHTTNDTKSPIELKLSSKQIDDMDDAPTMEGIKPQHHVYLSNGQVCYEVLAVPGFLPAYNKAMMEFNDVLAHDAKTTLNTIPADMFNGCSLSKDIFAISRHLEAGFPIQRWGPDGTHSMLLEFKRGYKADKTLFEMPASYTQFNIQDLRAQLSGG